MKIQFFLLSFMLLVLSPLFGQKTTDTPNAVVICDPFALSTPQAGYDKNVREATWLHFDKSKVAIVLAQKPRYLQFNIPQASGVPLVLQLERADPCTPSFRVMTPAGTETAYTPGVHYRGKILRDRNSRDTNANDPGLAAISIFNNQIIGVIADEQNGNQTLGRLGDPHTDAGENYVFFKDKNLSKTNPFVCGNDTEGAEKPSVQSNSQRMPNYSSSLFTEYIEVDFNLFNKLGGTINNSVDYVTALFNVVSFLYDRENVRLQLNVVLVWTYQDPYPSTTQDICLNMLTAFQNQMHNGFPAELAHLFSGYTDSHCGRAALPDPNFCETDYEHRCGVSRHLDSTFPFFPTYNWSVEVVAHEIGHNLNSEHTQWCGWPGGPIDGCVAPEGSCAPSNNIPVNGGTIMSYCHQNTSIGINLAHGFGTLPGNQIRLTASASVTCLPVANLNCNTAVALDAPSFTGTFSNASGTYQVSQYGCTNWNETGPERVFRLITTTSGVISATLSGMSADLDVFILDQCSEAFTGCLAHGDNTATTSTAVPAGEYYIVVDGYLGAISNFTLTVTSGGYCFSTGNTDREYIKHLTFGSNANYPFNSYGGGNNHGYDIHTFPSLWLKRNTPMGFTFEPGFTVNGTAFNEYWKIWVDENQNQIFDASEKYFSGGPSSQNFQGTLQVPASNGFSHIETRARVLMTPGSNPNIGPCIDQTLGEVEDFPIILDDYCKAVGSIDPSCWIDALTLNNVTRTTGKNPKDFFFDFATNFSLIRGATNTFTFAQGATNGIPVEANWRLFFDINQDRELNAASELLADVQNATGTNTGTFTVPTNATRGWTRIRLKNTKSSSYYPIGWGCDNVSNGEVEDYRAWVDDYCYSNANNTQEWIESFLLNPATGNNSGQNAGGYGDFVNQSFNLVRGQTEEWRFYPGFSGTPKTERWRAWIDFNHDHDFDDAGEMIVDLGGSTTWQAANVTIPLTAMLGSTRLRIQMLRNLPNDPCNLQGQGEIEDYTVFIDNYCSINPYDNTYDWINSIVLNHFIHATGKNATPYQLSTDFKPTLQKTGPNYIDFYPGYAGNADNVSWRVFIDANQDGDFFDAGEMLDELIAAPGNRLGHYFYLPATTLSGLTRMRVVMSQGPPEGPCGYYNEGEAEDFIVNVDNYCFSAGAQASWDKITNVTIGSINNTVTTGFFAPPYGNFTHLSSNAGIGTTINFSLTNGQFWFQAPPNNATWTIFADFDRDNDFSGAAERVATLSASAQYTRTGSFAIPINVTPGPIRLRICLKQNNNVTDACQVMSNNEGDVHDYVLNLVNACSPPPSPWAVPQGLTAAYVGVSPQSGVNRYDWRYRVMGTTTWTTTTATTPYKSIINLQEGALYEIQARVRCVAGNTLTAYGPPNMFSMPTGNANCGQSTSGAVHTVTTTTATARYAFVPNAAKYRIEWRVPNFLIWTKKETTAISFKMSDLQPNTTYEWRITVKCGATWGTPTQFANFTTLPVFNFAETADDREALDETTDLAENQSLTIFPNPFNERFTLVFNSENEGTAQLEVLNMAGQTIQTEAVSVEEGENQYEVFSQNWTPGVYLVALRNKEGVQRVKVIKN